jgi:hypothetical protein
VARTRRPGGRVRGSGGPRRKRTNRVAVPGVAVPVGSGSCQTGLRFPSKNFSVAVPVKELLCDFTVLCDFLTRQSGQFGDASSRSVGVVADGDTRIERRASIMHQLGKPLHGAPFRPASQVRAQARGITRSRAFFASCRCLLSNEAKSRAPTSRAAAT